jgi:hypothetical protein
MVIRALALVLLLWIVSLPRTSMAAEAPALALPNAHRMAGDVLKRMVKKLPPATADRMRGIYVAFDTAALDPYTLASCDDDGDYVVVMSDALLLLADFVAQAKANDQLDAYAAFSAREQRHGARIVPPPPGFFHAKEGEEMATEEHTDTLFRGIVASLVASELAEISLGHLACTAPTATHERNDDVWSAREREGALRQAAAVYTPARVQSADLSASWILSEAGEDTEREGSLAWLDFAARLERRGAALLTYLRLHPGSAARKATFLKGATRVN